MIIKTDLNFQEYPWQITYRTSSMGSHGESTDILHDFYIPALKRSFRYDRVAGYFRSSSLAAASQGFSAFVGNQGKARFIVGADLDPEDVQAVLDGSAESKQEEALSQALNRRLEGFATWPEDAQKGVHLLAWMVSKGFLEVRVAFRVHAEIGDPIPYESVADGYVHMKWALFRDGYGNRIYMAGSLNESRQALVLNAENIDIHCDWKNEDNLTRAEAAEKDFEQLWEDQNPYLRVLTLPEAVRKKLIKIAESQSRPVEIDGTSEIPLAVGRPSALEWLKFSLLKDGPKLPGGRYVGLETAPITPWPHQEVVARRLIESWPNSFLLCDEVGLGKTIEAGLVIRSLYLSGIAERVLIAAPAGLTKQWQREMESKFFLPFGRAVSGVLRGHEYIFPMDSHAPSDSLFIPNLVIVSTGLITRKQYRKDLQAAPDFDITLLDEAHNIRRSNPTGGLKVEPRYNKLFTAVMEDLRPKSRCLYLATATPMQLDPVEAFDLMSLTRRVGPFQDDPTLTQWYYNLLSRLVRKESLSTEEWDFLQKAVVDVQVHDPLYQEFIQKAVVDPQNRLIIRRWMEFNHPPNVHDLRFLNKFLFAASPLSRVMLRHNRLLLNIYRQEGKLDANLAERIILPIPTITFTDLEKKGYDRLETYCNELARQISQHADKNQKVALGFYLSFLRLRFASSLFALKETLRRRLDRVNQTLLYLNTHAGVLPEEEAGEEWLEEGEEDKEAVRALLKDRKKEDLEWELEYLRDMAAELSDLSGPPSKMMELLQVLEKKRRLPETGRIRQTVIFTRFYDTLKDIVKRLQQADARMLIGTYSGKGGQYTDSRKWRLVSAEREEVKHRFLRREIDVLVCTDAAAEGLNLQTANMLINFDLPWNPMKVEQRIGRIDRIGQEYETIEVLNLCYLGSAEEIVYGRLLNRLKMADAVVGTQPFSLLPVTQEEFQEIAEGKLDEKTLEKIVKERMAHARRQSESREIPPRDLYDIYQRSVEEGSKISSPVTLRHIWELLSGSTYLRDLGCLPHPDPTYEVIILNNMPGLPDGTAMTTSRQVYEYGIPELPGRLHFASYGDPVFDAVVDHICAYEAPPFVKRLAFEKGPSHGPLVAYLSAGLDESGGKKPQLITAFLDLGGLIFDETAELVDEQIEPFREELRIRREKEFQSLYVLERLEDKNREAGASQSLLNFLLGQTILGSREKLELGNPMFWDEVRMVEESWNEKKSMSISNLPADIARRCYGILFLPQIPAIGENASLTAPGPIFLAALDAACRLADKLHIRRAALTTEEVISRLGREVEALLRT